MKETMKSRKRCLVLLTVLSVAPVIVWLSVFTASPTAFHESSQIESAHKRVARNVQDEVAYPPAKSPKLAFNHTVLVNSTLAEKTLKKVKILCWITTQEKELKNKIKIVNETWASRCDKRMYVMTRKQKTPVNPELYDFGVPDGRAHLVDKTTAAFKHIHAHYVDDYDWFLKADDDTYIVMENLKHLLSQYDQNQGVYLGHLFKKYSKWGYMSGGAGYVLSRKAVKMLVRDGYNTSKCKDLPIHEDVATAHCLHRVGVPVHNTADKFGKESFHPLSAYMHLSGNMPAGMNELDRNPTKTGDECCSQLPISFHYTDPKMMRVMDFILYKTAVFGRTVDFSKFNDFFQSAVVPSLAPDVVDFNIPKTP